MRSSTLPAHAELKLFKSDARSRVWLVQPWSENLDHIQGLHFSHAISRDRPWVIKQYQFNLIRQRFAWMFQQHPVQREVHWLQKLSNLAVPVVAYGLCQGRGIIITPYLGATVADRIFAHQWSDSLAHSVASLMHELANHHLFFRDFKPANLVIDDAEHLRLIDVGSTRRVHQPAVALQRMARHFADILKIYGLSDPQIHHFMNQPALANHL